MKKSSVVIDPEIAKVAVFLAIKRVYEFLNLSEMEVSIKGNSFSCKNLGAENDKIIGTLRLLKGSKGKDVCVTVAVSVIGNAKANPKRDVYFFAPSFT